MAGLADLDIDTSKIRQLRDQLLAFTKTATLKTARNADSTGTGQGVGDATLQRIRPYAETMYLVMMADGSPDAQELDALSAAVEILAGRQILAEDIDRMFQQFADAVMRSGVEQRVAQLGAQLGADREGREIAFTLAAAVAMADQAVDIAENQVLEWVGEYYGISAGSLARLID